jgi:hypothetical protein
VTALLFSFLLTSAAPWEPAAQIESGVVNSRDPILNPTSNQQQQAQQKNNNGAPEEKGKPGPLPCNSKNNPKCDPESPSKPPDGKGKGN